MFVADHSEAMHTPRPQPWAVILAGGEGARLRPLTRRIAGDERPKQFCALIEGETLLDRTRRRVELAVRPDQHVIVVTRNHAPYWDGLARATFPGRLVVQPQNRGTAAGILYPLLRIRELAGEVPVGIFPSDHDITEDRAFMDYVMAAVDVVRATPDFVALLGIEAEQPESEYGWIESSRVPLPLPGEPAFPIRRFWEKPSPSLAKVLFERGCLWNSFVMVGWVSAFLELIRAGAPELLLSFEPLVNALGAPAEVAVADKVYAGLESLGFSEHILTRVPERLLTLRVKNVGWSDWGDSSRVVATLRRTGRQPTWLAKLPLAAGA
jgi:mannose-1-phosphate guanylyltransferase